MNLNKNAYACALCQDSFLDPNLLVEHVQTKHDLSPSKEENVKQEEENVIIKDTTLHEKSTNIIHASDENISKGI